MRMFPMVALLCLVMTEISSRSIALRLSASGATCPQIDQPLTAPGVRRVLRTNRRWGACRFYGRATAILVSCRIKQAACHSTCNARTDKHCMSRNQPVRVAAWIIRVGLTRPVARLTRPALGGSDAVVSWCPGGSAGRSCTPGCRSPPRLRGCLIPPDTDR
jgi:hypothetical protein